MHTDWELDLKGNLVDGTRYKITFDGNDSLIIEGMAFSDQDILNFIANLNAKSLIEQASLATMKVENSETTAGSNNKKGFVINCKLKAT